MKTIKFLFLAVVLMAQPAFATTVNVDPAKSENSGLVVAHISTQLENPDFIIEKEMMVEVTLIVNNLQEVVVLEVKNATKSIGTFIKSRLNYTKLDGAEVGEQFTIPVRMVPAS